MAMEELLDLAGLEAMAGIPRRLQAAYKFQTNFLARENGLSSLSH